MKVSIVGAGFSGLTLAYYLVKRGADVEILEKNGRAGGLIGTVKNPFGFAEAAANSLLNSVTVEELFNDISLPLAERLPSRRNRYIFRGGRPRGWPLGIWETLVFGLLILKAVLTFRLKPEPHETVSQWGRRAGGIGFEKYLLSTGLQGIYAGDAARMSAALILGRMFSKRKKLRPHIKGSVSPAGGMGQLIEKLTAWLEARGVRIRFAAAGEQPSGDALAVATSAWDAAEYLKDRAPEISKVLKTAESIPVVSVTVMFEPAKTDPRGFGCLFPRDEKFNSLGVLFMTDVFKGRGTGRTETWIIGGALNPSAVSLSDAEIESQILSDRRRLTGADQKPNAVIIHRWPRALPHYTREWDSALRSLRPPNGIFLTGNYLGRIGLSQILELNKELAGRICG